jgi:hypothetical protein
MLNWNVHEISVKQLLADKVRETRALVEQGTLTPKEAFLKISAFEDSLAVTARMADKPTKAPVAQDILEMLQQVNQGKVSAKDMFITLTEFEKQGIYGGRS